MNSICKVLAFVLCPLTNVNTALLWAGRQLSWVLIGGMVVVIGIQVFYRYVLNNALPWPEETARVMMIWMMALTAPSAYRYGGFVSITMILDAMPRPLGRLLNLLLLIMAGIVLGYLLHYALLHYKSGFIFRSSTLKIPLAYIYVSMAFCFGLMLSVNVELCIRALGQLLNGGDAFKNPTPAIDTEGS